jgi:hypothetical protein
MKRALALVAVTAVGLAVIAILMPSEKGDGPNEPLPPVPKGAAECPKPRVTHLSVRRASPDGYRVRVRVRAEVSRGGIGAFEVWWNGNSGLIADGRWPHRAATKFEHRYRYRGRPGTYRITVVAESSTEGCERLQKSEPATLRVHVPLNPTRYLLSL